MTPEERARALCAYNGPLFGIIHMTDSQRTIREALISSALADERRRVLEEAAEAANNMGQYEARNWCLFKAQEAHHDA